MRVASDYLAVCVDDDQGVRHRTEQSSQSFLCPSATVRGAQRPRAEGQKQHAGEYTSSQADHGDAFRLRRKSQLLLVQKRMLLLVQLAERGPNLLHQPVAFVGKAALAEPSKQILITQLYHVLHY